MTRKKSNYFWQSKDKVNKQLIKSVTESKSIFIILFLFTFNSLNSTIYIVCCCKICLWSYYVCLIQIKYSSGNILLEKALRFLVWLLSKSYLIEIKLFYILICLLLVLFRLHTNIFFFLMCAKWEKNVSEKMIKDYGREYLVMHEYALTPWSDSIYSEKSFFFRVKRCQR